MPPAALHTLKCDGCVLPLSVAGRDVGVRHERFAPGTPVDVLSREPGSIVRVAADGYVERFTVLDVESMRAVTRRISDRPLLGVVSA